MRELLRGSAMELQENMLDERARSATWQQIEKDMRLCGITDFPVNVPQTLATMVDDLKEFIIKAKSSHPNWDNLSYRIDLPAQLNTLSMSEEEYAKLILYRSFQKVWLRAQLSSSSDERSML